MVHRVAAMRERIGDDRQRMSQEMMELYKKEKVNPLGGCLPLILQMPIFIALYWALMESVELRHSPFFGCLPVLPIRPSTVLVGIEHRNAYPAIANLQSAGKERLTH